MSVTADWYWEGNVVEAIARFLAQDGWTIVGKADTHSKERGVDIQATRHGQTLLLEAKGYPSNNTVTHDALGSTSRRRRRRIWSETSQFGPMSCARSARSPILNCRRVD